VVAVLEALFLHEQFTRRVWLGVLGALMGTALLTGGGSATGEGVQTINGVLLALGASFGYSTMTLCSRALAGRYHPLQPMTWGLAASAVILLPFALAAGLVVSYPLVSWLLLFHLGLIPTALAFVLFLAGMRHTTATVASVVTMIEPLTATLLAWLLFGERLGQGGFLGAALLIGAIMLITWRREAR
jgi:drug/metabolite transporter, DME family